MVTVTRTLFVDESGNFSTSPRWIVSSVLCAGEPAAAEKRLAAALDPVRRRYRIPSVADMHLTELRKTRSHQEVTGIARAAFDSARDAGVLLGMLAVENARGEGLAESERTYRLMLLDLLALADALLPEQRQDAPLQVIVARRSKEGMPMSTREDLLADVIERIEDAIEAGLAARGLLGRLDAHHLRIWKAADSAGLALADFVANLSYNRHRSESGALFGHLVEQGRLRLFEGLGGYAERRARISERDGDLAVAVARWALLDASADADCDRRRSAAMVQLWRRILTTGSAGPTATLEAVLERLWRSHKAPRDHRELRDALVRIETGLRQTGAPSAMLYRLHNLMHQVANQMGDLPTAKRMMAEQSALAGEVALDPSRFHLMLDAQVLRTLSEELRLDFAAALRGARAHLRLTEQYGTLWELLDGAPSPVGFAQSRLWLKARMTLVRALLLAGDSEALVEAGTRLDEIDSDKLNVADASRLLGYRVWHALCEDRRADALVLAEILIDQYDDPFAIQYAARAAADAVLPGGAVTTDVLHAMLGKLRQRADGLDGHPAELIWRDIGVLEHRIGRRQRVRDALDRALTISTTLPNSPVKVWNRLVLDLHRSDLCGQAASEPAVPESVLRLRKQAQRMLKDKGQLMAFRQVSPY